MGVIGERDQFKDFNISNSMARISASVQAPSKNKNKYLMKKYNNTNVKLGYPIIIALRIVTFIKISKIYFGFLYKIDVGSKSIFIPVT